MNLKARHEASALKTVVLCSNSFHLILREPFVMSSSFQRKGKTFSVAFGVQVKTSWHEMHINTYVGVQQSNLRVSLCVKNICCVFAGHDHNKLKTPYSRVQGEQSQVNISTPCFNKSSYNSNLEEEN